MGKFVVRDTIRPIQQGGVDRLCGLYSIINAIICVNPDAYRHRQELFDYGCRYLISRKKLNTVLLKGMKPKLWRKLTRHLLHHHERMTSVSLGLHPLTNTGKTSADQIWPLIGEHVRRGRPILTELEGRHSHYTVIVDLTPSRVVLFDSDGLHWLQRSCCSFSQDQNACTHQLIGRPSILMT